MISLVLGDEFYISFLKSTTKKAVPKSIPIRGPLSSAVWSALITFGDPSTEITTATEDSKSKEIYMNGMQI